MTAWTGEAWDLGGAVSYSGAAVRHSPYAGVVVRFSGTDQPRNIRLPRGRHWPNHNLHAVVFNEQASDNVTIRDADAVVLHTLAAGRAAKCWLADNDGVGVWIIREIGSIST